MKAKVTEATVDARVAEQLEAQARRGVSLPIGLVRGLARTHLEMTAPSYPDPTPPPRAPEQPKVPPRPLPAPVAAVPPRLVASPVPAAVVADRARMAAIIEAAPAGAEAERDEAIRSGASVEDFRRSLGGFTILSAMWAARGR